MSARGDEGRMWFLRARSCPRPAHGAVAPVCRSAERPILRVVADRAVLSPKEPPLTPPRAPQPHPRFGFAHGLAVSLLIHAVLGGLGWFVALPEPVADTSETLVVELDGLLADTQQEEKQAVAPVPPPAPSLEQPPPQQRQAAPPPPPPAPAEPEKSESDVPEEVPPLAAPAQAAPTPPAAPAVVTPPDESQKAQSIASKPDEQMLLQQYGARLAKRVQSSLVYPDEERSARAQGTVKVAFAIRADGSVDPGSLRVVTGSGRSRLDAAALATIRQSAPYPPPPKPATIAFSLFFGKKK